MAVVTITKENFEAEVLHSTKPVLLDFWATWCAPCKEEMPTLQTLADLEGDGLVVLAVNVREPLPRVARYVQQAGLSFTVLPDPHGDITRAWGMTVFPTTVLVDTQGRPQRVVSGAVDWTGAQAQQSRQVGEHFAQAHHREF